MNHNNYYRTLCGSAHSGPTGFPAEDLGWRTVVPGTIISPRVIEDPGGRPLADDEPFGLLRFVHFPQFLRDWARLQLDDEDQRALEQESLAAPDRALVIKHSGGLRKLRFTPPGSGRGKRGAYRVGYAVFPRHGTIALFLAFGKNEQADLTHAQATAIAAANAAGLAAMTRSAPQLISTASAARVQRSTVHHHCASAL